MTHHTHCAEYIVVGGGMVGSAAALGLAQLGHSVVLLEAFPANAFAPEQAPDLRMSALALASVQLLDDMGAWEHIKAMRYQPYSHLAVWEDTWAKTTFVAAEVGHDVLGYFVENRVTQLGLTQSLMAEANVTIVHAKAKQVNITKGEVVLDNGDSCQGDWIIAADGVHSLVRKQAGIATSGCEYDQQAMGITVRNHYADEQQAQQAQQLTWQAFKPSGPVAFLPMHDNHASLIWYDSPQRLAELEQLDNTELKDAIQAHFPDQVGDFTVLDKARFPLSRMHAQRYVKERMILIGDAAHAINPLAGQGVNLGFADVRCLLDAVADNKSLLRHYQLPRQAANRQMIHAMDGLYHLFSNHNLLLKPLRNLGLFVAQRGGWAKQQVIKHAMGLR
jgi:2-octaprenyl-3-methyl-6-methoxy-1,4-benzoquinol hydroxylase